MIFYFSGTGNSRWVAEKIAQLTCDTAQDIIKIASTPDISKEKQIGFVFPVYAWGAPQPMTDFVSKLGKTSAFTFAVCTCGDEAGLALKKLAKKYPLNSSYSLVMPNNYIIGADVDAPQIAQAKIEKAGSEIDKLCEEINQKASVYRVKEGTLAALKSSLVNFGFNRFARSTKSFYATDHCNGCGLCASDCPAGTITLKDGKPCWGEECFQCLRCINACPQKAIQYGKSTETRGRYTFEKFRANQ